MCGIAGKLAWDGPNPGPQVAAMTALLAHRGPDDQGVVELGPIALGHRRLSIIDLSAAGHQPMVDASGRLWISYNGEIYNFLELREELAARGVIFRTGSDTEVVLEAYKAWGDQCVARFNGMFAFALWDTLRHRLLLVRDRLGKKPLFYIERPGQGVSFASELKALRVEMACADIDHRALEQYLAFGYVMSDACILRGVDKLPPAHYLVVERGKPSHLERYWDLAQCFGSKHRADEAALAEELAALIDDAVRYRLVADVDVGAFLSGGIDSTSIVSAMCRSRPGPVNHTFSIGFIDQAFDEAPFARQAAAMLGTLHHEEIAETQLLELLDRAVYHADEPFADTSLVPTLLLCEFAAKNTKVCLSGDGGDELFAGYVTYVADKLQRGVRHLPGAAFALARAAASLVPVRGGKVDFTYKLHAFLDNCRQDPDRAHSAWRTVIGRREAAALLGRRLAFEPYDSISPFVDEVADCHPLDRASYVDIKTWLVDDVLVKVDRASMAHGLEVRCPLLDHRIVEFAAMLPPNMKLAGFAKKYILKRSQRGRVPDFVLDRKKAGFNAPVSRWVEGALRPHLEELVLSGPLGSLIEANTVRRMLADHSARRRDYGFALFALAILGVWMQQSQRESLFRPAHSPAVTMPVI